jgi:ADP-ribose pyrophosphatase YjhB (NUDIX family)
MECTLHRLVADVAPLVGDRLVFVRYRDTSSYDGQRGWFLPDDLLEHAEHPDDAARRILREQLGWEGIEPRLSHIESFGNGRWHLIFHYAVELPEELAIRPGANVLEAAWFGSNELPPAEELAHGGWGLEVLAEIQKRRRDQMTSTSTA